MRKLKPITWHCIDILYKQNQKQQQNKTRERSMSFSFSFFFCFPFESFILAGNPSIAAKYEECLLPCSPLLFFIPFLKFCFYSLMSSHHPFLPPSAVSNISPPHFPPLPEIHKTTDISGFVQNLLEATITRPEYINYGVTSQQLAGHYTYFELRYTWASVHTGLKRGTERNKQFFNL